MYTYINNLIDSCSHKKGCWFYGFLSLAANKPVRYLPRVTAKVTNAVVIFDDEMYDTSESIPFENFSNALVLTGSVSRYKQLLDKKVDTVFWPWLHWFRYLIPLRRINVLPIINNNDEYVFNFLNRRWQSGRDYLIKFIVEKYPALITTGYISANNFVYYGDYPGIKKDIEFVNSFENLDKGARIEDPSDSSLIKEGCSPIVKNFYNIANHIPGKVLIQIETADINQEFFPLISEKSMLSFAVNRIPIIVSHKPGVINLLRNEGFDMFDDIINHEYDNIEDYYQRLEKCIELNLPILARKVNIPDINNRLTTNQNFLFNNWSNKKLNEIVKLLN